MAEKGVLVLFKQGIWEAHLVFKRTESSYEETGNIMKKIQGISQNEGSECSSSSPFSHHRLSPASSGYLPCSPDSTWLLNLRAHHHPTRLCISQIELPISLNQLINMGSLGKPVGKASHRTNPFKRSSSFLVHPSVFINAACIGPILVGQGDRMV